jgi:DNA-binding SARP family transcriptional activator
VALSVELLGPPRIARDGQEVRLRGRKTWALLAYLLLTDRPPPRSRLAELLFPDADDPLGALRWSLSQLRAVLGSDAVVSGDPVVTTWRQRAHVDLDLVRSGDWSEAIGVRGLGRELLEGLTVTTSAAFELWLATERRALAGAAAGVRHEAALASLAGGDVTAAVDHATHLVDQQPFDEANHVLLVRCLAATGDHDAAREHVHLATALLRHELDHDPSPALRRAATAHAAREVPDPSAVPAMLEVAETAIAAGAVPQGLRTLDEATAAARLGPDRRLLARVLLAQGRALVHVGLGGDEEGGAALHEAARLAEDVGDGDLVASARRELAYADLQRGRYDRARRSVAAARATTRDEHELIHLDAIDGACLSDQGHHTSALERLGPATARAAHLGRGHAEVFAGSFLGRSYLLRGQLGEAGEVLERAARRARDCWLAMAPWPEALLAEVQLRRGEVDAAEARLERAFVMGRQLEDPCLESIAMRGLGLVALARGRPDHGYRLLVEAPRVSRRLPDSYVWIEAYALDALATVATEHRPDDAARWVGELEALAARCGMRELVASAALHRARLGDPDAGTAARSLVAGIDDAALGGDLVGAGR